MKSDVSPLKSIARGSLVLVVATIAAAVLRFAFNVSMGWLLSPSDYGVLGVSMAFLMILNYFVESGFPWTVAKFLADEKTNKANVFKTSLTANLILGMILSAAFYLVAKHWFNLGEAYDRIIPVIAIIVVIFSVGLVCRYALQGLFSFNKLGLVDVLQVFSLITVALVLVLLEQGVFGAVMGLLAGALATLTFSFFFIRNKNLWGGKGWTNPSIIKFAAPMLFGILIFILMMNIDTLAIKFLAWEAVSDQLAGYYRSAAVLARIPIILTIGVMAAIFPYISRATGAEESRVYIGRTLKYACLFIAPLAIVFVVIPESILLLIFPETYLEAADALRIVSAGAGFLAFTYIFAQIFQAEGKPKVSALLLLPAFIIQIVLLYLLIPRYGIIGTATATTIACFAGFSLLLVRSIQTGKFRFRVGSLRVVIAYVILGAFVYLFPHTTRLLTVINLILGGLIYLISLTLLRILAERDTEILWSSLPSNRFLDRIEMNFKKAIVLLNKALLLPACIKQGRTD